MPAALLLELAPSNRHFASIEVDVGDRAIAVRHADAGVEDFVLGARVRGRRPGRATRGPSWDSSRVPTGSSMRTKRQVREVIEVVVEHRVVAIERHVLGRHVGGALTAPVVEKIAQQVLGRRLAELVETFDEFVGVEFVGLTLDDRLAPGQCRGPLLRRASRAGPASTSRRRRCRPRCCPATDRRRSTIHCSYSTTAPAPCSMPPVRTKSHQVLEVLESVGLGAHAHRVLGDREEVDEESRVHE